MARYGKAPGTAGLPPSGGACRGAASRGVAIAVLLAAWAALGCMAGSDVEVLGEALGSGRIEFFDLPLGIHGRHGQFQGAIAGGNCAQSLDFYVAEGGAEVELVLLWDGATFDGFLYPPALTVMRMEAPGVGRDRVPVELLESEESYQPMRLVLEDLEEGHYRASVALYACVGHADTLRDRVPYRLLAGCAGEGCTIPIGAQECAQYEPQVQALAEEASPLDDYRPQAFAAIEAKTVNLFVPPPSLTDAQQQALTLYRRYLRQDHPGVLFDRGYDDAPSADPSEFTPLLVEVQERAVAAPIAAVDRDMLGLDESGYESLDIVEVGPADATADVGGAGKMTALLYAGALVAAQTVEGPLLVGCGTRIDPAAVIETLMSRMAE